MFSMVPKSRTTCSGTVGRLNIEKVYDSLVEHMWSIIYVATYNMLHIYAIHSNNKACVITCFTGWYASPLYPYLINFQVLHMLGCHHVLAWAVVYLPPRVFICSHIFKRFAITFLILFLFQRMDQAGMIPAFV